MSTTLIAALATLMQGGPSTPAPAVGRAATSPPFTTVPKTLRLSFSNVDAGVVLRALAQQTGAVILYVNRARTPVSINIKAQSTEQAVRFVAASAGLAYRRTGQAFVVAPASEMRAAVKPFTHRYESPEAPGTAPRLVTQLTSMFPDATFGTLGERIVVNGLSEDILDVQRVLPELRAKLDGEVGVNEVLTLSSASPTEVAPVLQALFPNVKITAGNANASGGGLLAVSGRAEDIARLRQELAKLDGPESPQGSNPLITDTYTLRYVAAPNAEAFLRSATPNIEVIIGPETYTPPRAKFQPLTTTGISTASAGPDPAAALSGGAQGPVADGGAVGPRLNGNRARTLVLRGRRADVEKARELLRALDVKPLQVVVDVLVFETSPRFNEELGIRYDLRKTGLYEVPPGTGPVPLEDVSALNPLSFTRPTGLGMFSRLPLGFDMFLQAQTERQNLKILSKPSIQVIDNDQASIFVGQTLRVKIAQAGSLGAQTVDIREFPVGIILLMAPRVNADGDITMHVNPVVSTVASYIDGLPQTSMREAETSVVVKSGESIVIGGLIQDTDSKVVQEVPILSKIPIIGELFRNRRREKGRTELLISITPRIVPDNESGLPPMGFTKETQKTMNDAKVVPPIKVGGNR